MKLLLLTLALPAALSYVAVGSSLAARASCSRSGLDNLVIVAQRKPFRASSAKAPPARKGEAKAALITPPGQSSEMACFPMEYECDTCEYNPDFSACAPPAFPALFFFLG